MSPSILTSAPTTEASTLSLHDALPILRDPARPERAREGGGGVRIRRGREALRARRMRTPPPPSDRKSTRLNSSHGSISYAVFCLKKKKKGRLSNRTDPPTTAESGRVPM